MRHFIFTILLVCFSALGLMAQQPVSWTWKAKHIKGNNFEIVFKAKISTGWYTYSQFLKEGGPIPTTINFESNNETKDGKAAETTSKGANKVAGFDKMFEMQVIKYKKDLTIVQKITVKDLNKAVSGYLTYMTCDDTQCRPPTDVEFSFQPASLVQKTATKPPVPTTETGDQGNNGSKKKNQLKALKEDNTTAIVATDIIDNTAIAEENPNAAMKEPVVWDIQFRKISENEVDIVATATIADHWYIYSQTMNPDLGPQPSLISFADSANLEIITSEETATQSDYILDGHDEVFDMNVKKFKHDMTITQRLKVKDPSKTISGYLTYMTCDNSQCRPPTDIDFSFSFDGNIEAAAGTTDGNVFNPVRPMLVSTNQEPLGSCEEETGDVISKEEKVASMSWLAIFLAGFGGGLLALLTPCVFPMIPMTVALFSKGKGKEKKSGVKNALLFGASIIVIYVSLGLVVTSIFGASALNTLSTHWLMNLTFFFLFTIFAISFFGYFEISLPASWANKADMASSKDGLLGTFFGAFAISLVSFSCTGPIVGTLLVQAAINGGLGGPAIGMLGFSIALALPFTLFAIFPSWLQSLPRSGGWMTTMKVILGFIELALGLKFLSTADLTEHWGILPYELFVGLWAAIAIAMALYLFGLIRFPHDNPQAKIGLPRKAFGAFMAVFALYVLSGFMTTDNNTFITPPLLSGLAPSVCYSYIKPCDCPASLSECFHDYDEALAYSRKVNKPLLIDFTGYGCVNCRKMEDQVWTDKVINDLIKNEYVLVSLYVDDRQKLEKTLVAPDGRKIRNVGNKWALFQEKNFNKQSQPYYVLVNGKEEVLNKPKAYTPDKEVYQAFLECGISQYKKSMQE